MGKIKYKYTRELIKEKHSKLANQLHREEHSIIEREEPKHKAEYYYRMVSWVYFDLKEQLNRIEKFLKSDELSAKIKPKKKEKRPSTKWNLHCSDYLKRGKTLQEASQAWKLKQKEESK